MKWGGRHYSDVRPLGIDGPAKTPRQMPGNLRAPSEAALAAVLARLPNNGTSPYCDTYEAWTEFGLALYGASGGEGEEAWLDWCAAQPQVKYDPASKWETYSDTGIGWDTLMTWNNLHGTGPSGALAGALFDDGEVPGVSHESDTGTKFFTVDDFRSVVGEVDFLHVGTGAFWKAASVDAKIAPLDVGKEKPVKATAWIRAHRYVTELSWVPGRERLIEGFCMGPTGLEKRPLHTIFNLYNAPAVPVLEAVDAKPWCDLVQRLWPREAEEIFDWFAHRVQRPGEKINHALVLGGAPGIGKDTVLEGVRRAVGQGNCSEIMPSDLKSTFNGYIKSVLLIVNELRDDGQLSQYAFYDKSKTLIAAPPYVLSVNTKYVRPYAVPNVCGVAMTTNYKETGLYLPPDDRRHLVCWSDAAAAKEGEAPLRDLWFWLEFGGGFEQVAAWLRARDLSRFDPKAPPRKTEAFNDIAEASGSVEEAALRDRIERMGKPKVVRIRDLVGSVFDDENKGSGAHEGDAGLDNWLTDKKFRKVVAEALGKAGYRKVRNPGHKDGRWKVDGANEYVYGRKDVSVQELGQLARKLGEALESKGLA